MFTVHDVKTAVSPMASISKVGTLDEELVVHNSSPQGGLVLSNLPQYLSHLSDNQCGAVVKLRFDFPILFNNIPSAAIFSSVCL